MSFADKGAVADIDPAFFVGYLHRLKATGTLKFEDAPIQRAIYFRDGRVLFSSSNAPEDQLGAILVAAGKIEQDQFDLIVASLEPKQSIAAALAQGGHVVQRDIGDAARRKVEQIVGSCCAQTSGRYEFEDGVLPKGALDLKLTTEKVLISAFEALEPSGFLIRILKSPMAVLALAEAEPTEPDLARLRDALDGVSSLADIAGAVGMAVAVAEARAAVLVVIGAASVVTSQIEEMSLPDTGETLSSVSLMAPEDSEAVEAETLAFDQSLVGGGETFQGGSTLVMPPSDENGLGVSGDSTLLMGVEPTAPAGPVSSGLGRPDAPRRERATTQDLDAVNELIGTPKAPVSRPASSTPAQRWEPVLSSRGRPGRDRGGLSAFLQKPGVKATAAAILIAAVGTVGWLAYSGNRPAPSEPPAPPGPIASPAASSAVQDPGAGALLPVPPAATTPAPAAVTKAPAATIPPPAALPSTPVPAASAKATTAPVPKATPNPAPPPASVTAGPARPVPGTGYEAMKAGRLAEAATAFALVAGSHRAEFSVQILVACSPQTIDKAIQNDPSIDLFVLPAAVAGKSCHRLMRGFFTTIAGAASSLSTLPPYYTAEGAKPRAVAVKAVLP